MEQARRLYNEAQAKYVQSTEIAADSDSLADGVLALGQATRVHAKARQDYRDAFKRFADYVVHGRRPEDLAG
jgi:hypothetical protein